MSMIRLTLVAALFPCTVAFAQVPAPVAPAEPPPPIVANPPQSSPLDLEEDFPFADVRGAIKDGFALADRELDHWGESERDVIAEHFVDPIGATVGRKPPLDFSYDLMDLTGTGYKSLILWPRITQLQPRTPDRGGVLRIYVFDGKDWHLGLDDAAMVLGVRPHLDANYRPTGAMDLALIEDEGYKLFAWDEGTRTWKADVKSSTVPPVVDVPKTEAPKTGAPKADAPR